MERRGFLASLGALAGAAVLGLRVSLPFVAPPNPQIALADLAGLVFATDELMRDSTIDLADIIARGFAR